MAEKETLVVSSKVKNYIKSNGDLKCSAKVIDVLSDKIREMCDSAIEKAKNDKRKTVQEKDF
ncbi:histone-like protein [Oceanispirochaeta sp.]|jgi:histone H3/H4|uniref:histone-like protein n=1 Tax=Oceanispirochaeta sp. TaxID=2035350 RepID=UPI0026380AFD|nr:histone-like protein [Oceanispirochaeta sp.]MDA3956092.1 NFYB/HAP3 family transcription factor subunit [Oceanispirochaeta sp.]